jgi:hypothetical protein
MAVTPALLLLFHAAALAEKGWRIAPTCTCVHVPPRAVRTLRSLSLAAMAVGTLDGHTMTSSNEAESAFH